MENKLQELTEKLYREGLSKGETDAKKLVEDAQTESALIIETANQKAAQIIEDAKKKAQEINRNAMSELDMVSKQVMSSLRGQIQTIITTSTIGEGVSSAWRDGQFIKELVLKTIDSWNPSDENGVKVILPDGFSAEVERVVRERFNQSVEVVSDTRAKVPFRIEPSEGGYFINFTDEAFAQLIEGNMREQIAKILFAPKQ